MYRSFIEFVFKVLIRNQRDTILKKHDQHVFYFWFFGEADFPFVCLLFERGKLFSNFRVIFSSKYHYNYSSGPNNGVVLNKRVGW